MKENRHLCPKGDLFKIWNKQLVYFGSRIIQKRALTVAAWGHLAARNYSRLFDAGPRLKIEYLSFLPGNILAEQLEKIEEAYKAEIMAVSAEELQKGFSLVGPHRDDLSFLLDGREARRYASHGQQRSAVIALKAAQLQFYHQKNEKPVFMLDDIFSELDSDRVLKVIKLLSESKAQIFITSTNKKNVENEINLVNKFIEIK